MFEPTMIGEIIDTQLPLTPPNRTYLIGWHDDALDDRRTHAQRTHLWVWNWEYCGTSLRVEYTYDFDAEGVKYDANGHTQIITLWA